MTWLSNLTDLKYFWITRYNTECENDTQRQAARQNFIEALAKYYGGKPTDQDIINEVDLELGIN